MYKKHFGFNKAPFSISPDPHFLYMSDRHRDALAHLVYGVGENGGFALLTGQVGTGKTTLIRSLLQQELKDIDIALCLNPNLSVMEFIASILDELGVIKHDSNSSLKFLIDTLNVHLLESHAKGRQTVVIIDEGQNLKPDVLEQIRLLTNLETNSHKLLRIILVGQEELLDIINRNDLRQLSQRITIRYHLTALESDEVEDYIQYRLKAANGSPAIFPHSTIKQIYKITNGTPRLINVLCDRALLGAFSEGSYTVNSSNISSAANEIFSSTNLSKSNNKKRTSKVIYGLAILSLLGLSWLVYSSMRDEQKLELSTKVISTPPIISPVIKEEQKVAKETVVQNVLKNQNNETTDVSRETSVGSSNILLTNETILSKLSKAEISQGEAISTLLGVWGLSDNISVNKTPCSYAEENNMICDTIKGDFSLLKQINRPALLELKNKNKNSSWVTLQKVIGLDFIIQRNKEEFIIPFVDIADLWTGNFLVLLDKPNVSIEMKPDFTGKQVKWVRQRIALANKKDFTEIKESLSYDSDLVDKIKDIQSRYSLDTNGIIKDKTLLYLYNTVTDTSSPKLFEE